MSNIRSYRWDNTFQSVQSSSNNNNDNNNNRELIERFRKLKALYNLKKNIQCPNIHNYTNQWYTSVQNIRKGTNICIQNLAKTHAHNIARRHTHTHTHARTHARTHTHSPWRPPRGLGGRNLPNETLEEEEEEEEGTYRSLSETQSALQLKEKHTMRKYP